MSLYCRVSDEMSGSRPQMAVEMRRPSLIVAVYIILAIKQQQKATNLPKEEVSQAAAI